MLNYNDIIKIDWISKKEVEENQKTGLKNYELLGVEEIINQLINGYEAENFGGVYSKIKENDFFRNDKVKLSNSYRFDEKELISAFISMSDEMVVAEFYNIKKEEFVYYRID